MEHQNIILRPAGHTHSDGQAFARYLDTAAEGFFHFMLGRRSEEIITEAFLEPDHDLSWQNVTFAERDGIIVGMVSGFTGAQHRQSSLQPLKKAAGRFNLRMKTITLLFSPLLRIMDTVAENDYYLQAIAVNKDLRGCGAGSILLGFLEKRACNSQSTRLSLDVSAKNKGACRFYERRGMSIESQWPKRIPIPGLKLFRMTKEL